MSIVTAHTVYVFFCAYACSEIFRKHDRELREGQLQCFAGINELN